MSEYPQLREAARAIGQSLWSLVDAIGAEARVTDSGNLLHGEAERLVGVLAEEGLSYTEARVRDLHLLAKSPLARGDLLRSFPVRYAEQAYQVGASVEQIEATLVSKPREYWTLRKLNTALTGKPWTNTPEEVTPEQEREIVRRVMAREPELVAEEIAKDPAALRAVQKAHSRDIDEQLTAFHNRPNQPESNPDLAAMEHLSEPNRDTARVRDALGDIRRHMPDWDRSQRDHALQRLRPLIEHAMMLAQALEGVGDIDAALRSWSAE